MLATQQKMYKIKPDELYENYLKFYKTDVFEIVMSGEKMIDTTKTVMSVNYDDPRYTFDIYLQGYGTRPVHFDLYANGHNNNLFDEDQSAIYVWYAAMNLVAYRGPIDKYAMQLLSLFLRSKTRNQKQQLAYMHPLLFYKNLIHYASQNPNITILRRDERFTNDGKLQIRPIYDPSCHSVSIYHAGRSLDYPLEMNEETYDRLQYQFLAIVDALARSQTLDSEFVEKVVTTTKFDKTYYMDRLKPLNKSRLFACKISRLRYPRQQDVKYATELFDRVFDAYSRLYANADNADELIENACDKTLENMYQDLLMIRLPQ